jgi:hypothetical protein
MFKKQVITFYISDNLMEEKWKRKRHFLPLFAVFGILKHLFINTNTCVWLEQEVINQSTDKSAK